MKQGKIIMKYTEYTNKQEFIKAAKAQIKGYRDLMAMLDHVDTVADQFAGKVLNKRFFDAITALAPKYRPASLQEDTPAIVAIRPTEYYQTHAIEFFLTAGYDSELQGERVYLGSDESKTQFRGIDENGRIVPAYWHKGVEAKRIIFRDRIYDLEDAIKGYDDYVGSLKAMIEELTGREKEINPLFRQEHYSMESGVWLKERDGKLGGYFARRKASGMTV